MDIELDVAIEIDVDREVDAGFDVELGMVFVEPDTNSIAELEVIVPPAFVEAADSIEAPTLAVDAGLIDEPLLRLETALLPEELGTQHSATLERPNTDEVCKTYFSILANRTPPRNEKPPITAVRCAYTHALAVRRITCSGVDAGRTLRGYSRSGTDTETRTGTGTSKIGNTTLGEVKEMRK